MSQALPSPEEAPKQAPRIQVRLSERLQGVLFILPAVAIGTLFHFVALAEVVLSTGHLSPVSVYHSESLLAFFLMLFFFGV